jgi:hypothetical protein
LHASCIIFVFASFLYLHLHYLSVYWGGVQTVLPNCAAHPLRSSVSFHLDSLLSCSPLTPLSSPPPPPVRLPADVCTWHSITAWLCLSDSELMSLRSHYSEGQDAHELMLAPRNCWNR